MKIIREKYRTLKPEIEYISDEVVIAQAWKKTHAYIRSFNWYADTLALDVSALGIETNAREWARQIKERRSLYPLELAPAAKSESWIIDKKDGWVPKEKEKNRKNNPPIRPLAHITVRDQTWATAAMMCLADVVETAQGDCSNSLNGFQDAQGKKVYSYGNRLVCDWNDDNKAWFRWGNSEIYRRFFIDYQNFLKRPVEIGRTVAEQDKDNEYVFIVNLDLSKFYNNIDKSNLIARLKKLSPDFIHDKYEEFWQVFGSITNWQWRDEDIKFAKSLSLPLGDGLPQGLVAAGFFANAYMINFDQKVGESIGKELFPNSDIILHDYCRYVDDLRLVVSTEELSIQHILDLINEWINQLLKIFAGNQIELNVKKSKVTTLADLDNSGSMANRIKMLQSELSGPADRDILNAATGILESLLTTENEDVQEFPNKNHRDSSLIELAKFDNDIRPDTLKRFSANRLESIMRSKRMITPFDEESELQLSMKQSDNESELLAKKLIYAWMKDPSLGLVLRKAIEIYPSADLFEPVFDSIYNHSSFSNGKQKSQITAIMMDYLLADLFRSTCDFNGFFQYVTYPPSLESSSILELAARYAQKVISSGSIGSFIERQALMLLAIVNKPVLIAKSSDTIQHSLHAILVSKPPKYQAQRSALFEVAAQITGRVDTFTSLYLEHIAKLGEKRYEALEPFAKRGGPFWLSLWKQIKKHVVFKELATQLKWAAPIISSAPKPITQRLSKVIASDLNGFEHEAALIKLALGLIKLEKEAPNAIEKSPTSVKVSFAGGVGWNKVWHPDITEITCTLDSRKTTKDPRFAIPEWLETTTGKTAAEAKLIYWVGMLLRASVLGGSDFTGHRFKKGRTITYKGLRTNWYKRRMGMMHAPEAIVGEYSTVSDWFSELLMRCLQWPGFESSFVRHEDVKAIIDLASLKAILNARLKKLNDLYCHTSDMPTVSTKVKRPKLNGNRGFRVVTVQSLLPRSADFCATDPLLSNPKIRAAHREHLMAVCQLTYKTLEAKLKADKDKSKPAADLIVFPEVSVHVDDQDVVKRLADKTQAIIFAGLVFTDHNGKLVNVARWFIPDYRESGRQWIIRDQGKKFMTKHEKSLGVSGHRPCQHIIEIHGLDEELFRLSGAICYDATDISLAADLRDKTDLFVVVAHNQDVNTFDNMAAALHYHMYQHVVIVNIGEYGGTTIQAPFAEPYHRLISHVHGSEQISINMADIDLAAFRRKHVEYKKVKAKPAGFIKI